MRDGELATAAGSSAWPQELPVGEEKAARVRALFDTIAPRYDLVNRVMTLGLDTRWRRRTVDALGLPAGSLVLDLACGTGDLGRLARRRGHRAMGVDFSAGMLACCHGLPAVEADGANLALPDASVDGVVSGYALRNFTDLGAVLAEAARVLRPGGRIALLEVASPPNPLLRAGFSVWFDHVVPLIGAVLSNGEAYRYLPRSVEYLPDPADLRKMLRSAGFSTVGHRLFEGGLSQLFTATREGIPPWAMAGSDDRTPG